MIEDKPLVSIILPTYNRAHLIGESIQSVIDQTYDNWELIVVDDGSVDNTKEVVSNFNNSKIEYLKIAHSGHLGAVRNYGIRVAKGAFIAFFDSDDLWRVDKLDFQLKLFKKNPKASFIIGNGRIFGTTQKSAPEYESFSIGSFFIPILEEQKYVFYSPTLMFKRELCEKFGLMDENLSGSADMEYFLRLCHSTVGMFTNERLVNIRKHDQNVSEKFHVERYANSISIIKKFYHQGFLTRKQYSLLVRKYNYKAGLIYFERTNYKRALSSFYNSAIVSPLYLKAWARLGQCAFRAIIPIK